MAKPIILPIREANLLRLRSRRLAALRLALLDKVTVKLLHDTRVASRRLREILSYIEPALPPSTYKKSDRLISRITKSLGPTRELQVNLKVLTRLKNEKGADRFAIELLLYSQEKKRKKFESRAAKRIAKGDFDEYEDFVMRIHGNLRMPSLEPTLLKARLEVFRSFPFAPDLEDEKLHELRIETKKLRYTVEIYSRVQQQKLSKLLRKLKRFQEVLGEFHDYCVVHDLIENRREKYEVESVSEIPKALERIEEIIVRKKRALRMKLPLLYEEVVRELNPLMQLLAVSEVLGEERLREVARTEMVEKKKRILFLCTGNSARSQMAEALLRAKSAGAVEAFSAGTTPKGMNPLTIEAMSEIGIDVSRQVSKDVSTLVNEKFDLVITVCDRAKESCPVIPGAVMMHWDIDDPHTIEDFRQAREDLSERIESLLKKMGLLQ